MSNIFHLSGARGNARDAHRRAKFDVITAAMLTGGASGGWGMARAFKSRAARDEAFSHAPDPRAAANDHRESHSQAA